LPGIWATSACQTTPATKKIADLRTTLGRCRTWVRVHGRQVRNQPRRGSMT